MGLRDLFGAKAKTTADLIAESEAARPGAAPEDAIVALVHAGEKIEAIKLYREQTGVGLADAKDAIDAIARGETVPAPASGSSMPQPSQAAPPGQGDDDIRALAQQRQMIPAIKLYRQRYGVGLAEAKDAVDRIAAQRADGGTQA